MNDFRRSENPTKPTTSERYEQPLLISFGFSCPVHGCYHQKSVAIAKQPKPNEVISLNQCTDVYPGTPVYVTRLYGNLRLVTEVKEKK